MDEDEDTRTITVTVKLDSEITTRTTIADLTDPHLIAVAFSRSILAELCFRDWVPTTLGYMILHMRDHLEAEGKLDLLGPLVAAAESVLEGEQFYEYLEYSGRKYES